MLSTDVFKFATFVLISSDFVSCAATLCVIAESLYSNVVILEVTEPSSCLTTPNWVVNVLLVSS